MDEPVQPAAIRDSGAILVGAGAPPPGTHGRDHGPDRSRLDFSNFGARVDAQGWGEEVTTCGYGDLQGGTNEDLWYTDTFSGTSSASPIVVGALGCLQGVLRARGPAAAHAGARRATAARDRFAAAGCARPPGDAADRQPAGSVRRPFKPSASARASLKETKDKEKSEIKEIKDKNDKETIKETKDKEKSENKEIKDKDEGDHQGDQGQREGRVKEIKDKDKDKENVKETKDKEKAEFKEVLDTPSAQPQDVGAAWRSSSRPLRAWCTSSMRRTVPISNTRRSARRPTSPRTWGSRPPTPNR